MNCREKIPYYSRLTNRLKGFYYGKRYNAWQFGKWQLRKYK